MNRHAIASIIIDAEGFAVWQPTKKFQALGFKAERLGKPDNPVFFAKGLEAGYFKQHLPDEWYDRVMALNTSARHASRAKRIARKMAVAA
jgi:hypothetical protein